MDKYEHIFNTAPIAIWEEDWNEIRILLDSLRENIQPSDLMDYLNSHPKFVNQLARAIKVIRVNSKTIEIYEAESELDLKKSITDTFCEESFITFKKEIEALYRGDKESEFEFVSKTIKGNKLYTIINIKFPANNEEYHNVLITMIDITSHKEIQKKNTILLERNVDKYKQLLDSTQTAFTIIDNEGDICDFSDTFTKLMDCNKSCLDKKSFRSLISTESIPAFDDAWNKIQKGQTVNCVEVALTKGSVFKWVSINGSMIRNGGIKIFVLITDITERKRKEFDKLITKEKHRDRLRNNIKKIRDQIGEIGK